LDSVPLENNHKSYQMVIATKKKKKKKKGIGYLDYNATNEKVVFSFKVQKSHVCVANCKV